MSEWITCTLGEVAEFIQTGPFGSQLHQSDYSDKGIPVVMPQDMDGGRIVTTNIARVEAHHVERLKRHKLQEGDIVYSRRGDVGRSAYVSENQSGWLCGTGCLLVRLDKTKVCPRFIAYYLRQESQVAWVENNAVGITMLNLNTGILAAAPLRIPSSIEEQKRIADELTAIDEKIEHNNEHIKMLEEKAQLVYDYWFMQFDFPDENGMPYRSRGGKMVWNEVLKRELPEGWRVERLSEHAHITMGTSPVGSSLNELQDGMLFFQGSTDFGSVIPEVRVYTTSPKRTANAGDLLFSVRAPVGSMNYAAQECCIGRGLAALSSAIDAPAHLWQEMRCLAPHFDKYNLEGSIFGCIGRDALHALPVLTPNIPLIEKYQKEVGAIHERYIALAHENVHLAAQRDFLLPLLMSGLVTVAE